MSNPQTKVNNIISDKHLKGFQNYYEKIDERGLSLKGNGTDSLSAWFLGPKGENVELLKSLINTAIDKHIKIRQEFHPEDPVFITEDMMKSEEHKKGVRKLKNDTENFLNELQQSVPFFSLRYLGHMNWDTTLPAMVGYFAGLLYNQNNVAAEASPVTTMLEIEVGKDLCHMLGYKDYRYPAFSSNLISPWGHITCDGSVANLEALWASRNLKFFPISLKNAISKEEKLSNAKPLEVQLLNGNKQRLIDLNEWELLNLKADDVLSLPQKIQDDFEISIDVTTHILQDYSVQNIGLKNIIKDKNPVAIAPVTQHYSWPKSAAVLGLGSKNMLNIKVDLDARMDIDDLRRQLTECEQTKQPVITVVAVIGSTEISAVDPLRKIIDIREEFRQQGLDFAIHVDAAWGGYFASLLRKDDIPDSLQGFASFSEFVASFIPSFPLSDYVAEQYYAMKEADSITIDPHKAGYIPYPAGGLCYRNSAMRNLVAFSAPVVHHNEIDPTVGIYGIEGSKPGAAAASTYLSHKVIRPTQDGYGRILGECIFTSKKIYSRLVSLQDDKFIVVPFHRLPSEKEGETEEKIQEEIKFIRKNISKATNEQIVNNKDAMDVLRKLGSDQTITPYIFNFKDDTGKLNSDIKKMNKLNKYIFDILSIVPGEDAKLQGLMVTSSEFKREIYEKEFIDSLKERLGVKDDTDEPIVFIISTVMNPWLTDINVGSSPQKSFLDVIEQELRNAVYKAMDEMKQNGEW